MRVRIGTYPDYYYWLDESKAPDFARTVDIHRKPGYDPVELFIDPQIRFTLLKVAKNVAKKKLGMRMLMDMIPLTPELVKGSHGRLEQDSEHGPLLLGSDAKMAADSYPMQSVFELIQRHFC